ncbi:hypothetical protein HJ526_16575 [Donghicola sp. C2-DW-16]|uniref:Uncharacterized protein n=1 Tax=Donghicola mangrovi TaxID=2729614 RepID=A0A850QEH8_9RHOB|nr:hypothetical protein [Donghicola mangrovi]NVO24815.1 hypothetical protein [Donghicola mangrovi]NVO29046.1 hypothetical protein [Donghicola mangrovi]
MNVSSTSLVTAAYAGASTSQGAQEALEQKTAPSSTDSVLLSPKAKEQLAAQKAAG